MKARVLLSVLSVLAATLAFSGGPAFANADSRHLMRTRVSHSAALPLGSSSNLYFHGGAVETRPAVYLSYWGVEWQRGFTTGGHTSASARDYLNHFFGDVGGSSWANSTTQYCQSVPSGTVYCPSGGANNVTNPAGQLKGVWNDTTRVPLRPSSSSIASAALRAVAHFGYDPNATYMVFTPAGKSTLGFGWYFCAWHDQTTYQGKPVAYANMPYQPDAGASCGMNYVNPGSAGYFDGFSIVGGHEYAEAITDPDTSTAQGWLDSSGSENGDKCAWGQGPGPDANSQDITLGGRPSAVQPLWSNAANGGAGGCVIRY